MAQKMRRCNALDRCRRTPPWPGWRRCNSQPCMDPPEAPRPAACLTGASRRHPPARSRGASAQIPTVSWTIEPEVKGSWLRLPCRANHRAAPDGSPRPPTRARLPNGPESRRDPCEPTTMSGHIRRHAYARRTGPRANGCGRNAKRTWGPCPRRARSECQTNPAASCPRQARPPCQKNPSAAGIQAHSPGARRGPRNNPGAPSPRGPRARPGIVVAGGFL